MPAPIELALSTLLPTISFLPPDLISLANSLLSQSRAKAASLKPEEEIGRTYACAQIACERLKKRLDLEIEKPKPPCHPRVYGKLYGYLDGILGAARGARGVRGTEGVGDERGTPGGRGEGRGQGTPSKLQRQDATPSKRNGDVEVKTPTTATKVGMKRTREEVLRQEEEQRIEGLPAFITHMVRALCKATSTPKAVPHILVGAQAVAAEIASRAAPKSEGSERKRRRRRMLQSAKSAWEAKAEEPPAAEEMDIGNAVAASKWPAILITLHTLTVTRMRGEKEADENLRKQAIKAVRDFVNDRQQSNSNNMAEGLASSLNPKSLRKDIDFYTLEAEDCGWLDLEWYQNVPEAVDTAAAEDDDEEQKDGNEEEDDIIPRKKPHKTPLRRKEKHGGKAALFSSSGEIEDEVGAAGLLPGLGTMFQPGLDWLDDERRADYRAWKKDTFKEIAAIEAGA